MEIKYFEIVTIYESTSLRPSLAKVFRTVSSKVLQNLFIT